MLLERDGLLKTLRDQLSTASQSGSLVLVAGEAGAGKTTLVREFTRSLDRGTLVIEGACDPLTTPRPLSPLHDFANDPDAGLSPITADRERMEIFNEVLDRLRNTIRPIVMVIEDIHWADAGTLDFLRFVGRRVSSTKSIVICTYRDDEVGADHPLRPVLGQLIPLDSTIRLSVPALSESAVAILAGESDIDPMKLHHLSGGNAFFVTEVLASHTTLPETVQDAVLARVGNLDERSRRAVEAVSIAPRSLELEKASALVGASTESIDRAVGSGVLLGDGTVLRFRHELARAAVEQSIPPARRLKMHQQMIALLEEDNQRDPARLAHHAIQADSPEMIVEYAPEAGHDAVARGARREAVAFYEAALEYSEELGPDKVAEIRLELARQLRLLDDPDESVRQAELAITYIEGLDDPERLATALGVLDAALWNQHRIEESQEVARRAVAILRPLPPSPALADALYRVAHMEMLARQGGPAMAYVEEAMTVAKQVEDADSLWLAEMMAACTQIVVGEAEEGARGLAACVESAKAMGDPHFVSIGLLMLGSGGGEARLYDEAIPALLEGVEQGLATDQDYGVAYNRAWMARIAFEQGRWDDAVEYAELVAKTTQQKEGIAYITAMSALGRVRVRRGDPGGIELLEEMVQLAEHHELQHGWNAICGRSEYLWLRGRGKEALDVLAPAYEKALQTDSEWAQGELGFWMWKVGAIEGPSEKAAEPFALQMSGDWRAAAEAWREIGCPYEVALALADGDEESMLEAVAGFDSLGAKPAADLVRSRLRDMGVERVPRGPTSETRDNPMGLTARQLDVLRLMTQGKSNAEIADELFISKKTVEHHVSAIFTKLEVSDRAEAVKKAADSGIFLPRRP